MDVRSSSQRLGDALDCTAIFLNPPDIIYAPVCVRVFGRVRSFHMTSIPASLPLAQSGLDWHAASLGQAVLYTVLFSLLGIGLAIVGYKLFDVCTPGNLHEEILKHRNTAAALIGAAVIIGVCIVVAAAIMG